MSQTTHVMAVFGIEDQKISMHVASQKNDQSVDLCRRKYNGFVLLTALIIFIVLNNALTLLAIWSKTMERCTSVLYDMLFLCLDTAFIRMKNFFWVREKKPKTRGRSRKRSRRNRRRSCTRRT